MPYEQFRRLMASRFFSISNLIERGFESAKPSGIKLIINPKRPLRKIK